MDEVDQLIVMKSFSSGLAVSNAGSPVGVGLAGLLPYLYTS